MKTVVLPSLSSFALAACALAACNQAPSPAQSGTSDRTSGSVPAVPSAAAKRKLIPAWEDPPDELPVFTEAPPGKKAPTSSIFGARVGTTTFDEAVVLTKQMGATCSDRSMRTAMDTMRASKKLEIEQALAQGKAIDSVTGASIVQWRSPRETNPQVRWACDGIDAALVKDRARPTVSPARLLFIFDSKNLPLRHVSLQRMWPKAQIDGAIADLRSTFEHHEKLYGPPTTATGELPTTDPKSIAALRSYSAVTREWVFADLKVRVQGLNFPNGFNVQEEVDVPMPLRADAPARPATMAATAP